MTRNISLSRLFTSLFSALLLSYGSVHAQISDCSIFLLGQKVEAGINWNGALGASTAPPAGSHANWSTSLYNSSHCSGTLYTGTSLAVIADPDEDGWTTGSIPFFGDFVLPGGANEGWSLMFNGVQKNAWNCDAATQDSIDGMSAYLYSYTDSAGLKIAKTQAVFNGLYITQWVFLDTSKLFLSFQVLIENTDLAAASDVYYMRMINPHNDPSIPTPLPTWNRVLYQFPDTGSRSVVTSRGSTYNNAFLALGTKDTRAKAFIAKHAQLPNAVTVDYIDAEDTGFMYNVNDSVHANACMGIEYNLGLMNSGTGALMNFFYAFRPDAIEDAIYASHVGINDAIRSSRLLNAYPNPTQNNFWVTGMHSGDELLMFDITGRQVSYSHVTDNQYNIQELAPGTYVGMVKDKTGVIKGRLRLQKL